VSVPCSLSRQSKSSDTASMWLASSSFPSISFERNPKSSCGSLSESSSKLSERKSNSKSKSNSISPVVSLAVVGSSARRTSVSGRSGALAGVVSPAPLLKNVVAMC